MSFYFPNLTFLRVSYMSMPFEFYSLSGTFHIRSQLVTEPPSKQLSTDV